VNLIGETNNMLTQVADGVLVRESSFCQSNAVVIRGDNGVLLVDPGVDGNDLSELADDLATLGKAVAVGFSSHPHWDHLLWHARLGQVPRYGTPQCAAVARARLADAREKAARLAADVPLELLGAVTALPQTPGYVPWAGPAVRVIEHQAHAPGHAALVIESRGVLIAGDMLSDVEIPLLDLSAEDPYDDYLTALQLLEDATTEVTVAVPGHGSVARQAQIGRRIDADRTYVQALQVGRDPADPRVGPLATYGRDWLPGEHQRQVRHANSWVVTRRRA
jgi:glyoxylase-like metal-dependent hydrolase (beta-lactamase superfamily II)